MTGNSTKTIKFSINSWTHLYSLEQAVLHAEESSGKSLRIEGTIRKELLSGDQDFSVRIRFDQVSGIPNYQRTESGDLLLGQLIRSNEKLEADLPVDENVFEELRKNLMEYADIDGIHIVVTIGLQIGDQLANNQSANIVKLDYAMRGDA